MTTLRNTINHMLNDESGLSSVEYALLLAFIAAGVGTVAITLGEAVTASFTASTKCISTPTGC
jgi:Flp pilus assembly pilin Flp